jgi:hypothetical protein
MKFANIVKEMQVLHQSSAVKCTGFPVGRRANQVNYFVISFHERFEVSMMVSMKNAILWDVTPFGTCKNRYFGGMYRLHHQDDKNQLRTLALKNGVLWDVTLCGHMA